MEKEAKSVEKLICDTLLEMLETQPYYTVKVTDLVNKAGISRSCFYVYFDSIYAVLQKIEDDFLELFPEADSTVSVARERHKRDDGEMWENDLDILVRLKDHRRIYCILTGPNGEPSFGVRLRNRMIRIHDRTSLATNPHTPESQRKLLSIFFAGGKFAVMDYWNHHADQFDDRDYMEFSISTYTKLLNYALRFAAQNPVEMDRKKKLGEKESG